MQDCTSPRDDLRWQPLPNGTRTLSCPSQRPSPHKSELIDCNAHQYPPMQPPLYNIEPLPHNHLHGSASYPFGKLQPGHSPQLFSYDSGQFLRPFLAVPLDSTDIFAPVLVPSHVSDWHNSSLCRCICYST